MTMFSSLWSKISSGRTMIPINIEPGFECNRYAVDELLLGTPCFDTQVTISEGGLVWVQTWEGAARVLLSEGKI